MKKLLPLILIVSVCSCTPKPKPDPHMAAIEKDIQKHALGMDIGYKPGHLDTIVRVSCGMTINDFEKMHIPIMEDFSKVIDVYSNIYETDSARGDIEGFKIQKWEVAHMKRVKSMDTAHLDYSVYKYTYTTDNVFNPKGPRTEVSQYYFFDYNDSLVGFESPEDIQYLIQQNTLTDLHPYELALISLQTGVPIN